MISRILFLVFIPASMTLAQLDSNSVTVTASTTSALQADQVVFNVSLIAPITTSLNDVLAALTGTGITQANLSGGYQFVAMIPGLAPAPTVTWNFTLPVPLSQLKATVATLNGLQTSIAAKNNGMQLSFSVNGTQVSTQLQQSQTCSPTSLITSARARAQNLVTTAGLRLGNILAMSSPTPASGCSLTVKFQLMR
jgi:hypothetical protein